MSFGEMIGNRLNSYDRINHNGINDPHQQVTIDGIGYETDIDIFGSGRLPDKPDNNINEKSPCPILDIRKSPGRLILKAIQITTIKTKATLISIFFRISCKDKADKRKMQENKKL